MTKAILLWIFLSEVINTKWNDCAGIFLDFGSNVGVQARKFFEPDLYPNAPLVPLFERLYGPVETRRKKFCVIGFEANPHHTERLKLVENCHRKLGWKTIFFSETAVSNKDGVVDFYADAEPEHNEWGSSIFDHNKKNLKYSIKSVDIASFIKKNLAVNFTRTVVAKMDIEGSEYIVLPHMLESEILCNETLAEIMIEWHPKMVPVEQKEIVQKSENIMHLLSKQTCVVTKVTNFDDESYLFDTKPFPAECLK
jgi:FkbM family methyltransferase